MQKIDLYSLSVDQLDWLTAKALMIALGYGRDVERDLKVETKYDWQTNEYVERWSQEAEKGGELIEKFAIAVRKDFKGTWYAMGSDDLGNDATTPWVERSFKDSRWAKAGAAGRCVRYKGSTMAQAVSRCFVGWVMGLQQGPSGRMVEVPEILGGD